MDTKTLEACPYYVGPTVKWIGLKQFDGPFTEGIPARYKPIFKAAPFWRNLFIPLGDLARVMSEISDENSGISHLRNQADQWLLVKENIELLTKKPKT